VAREIHRAEFPAFTVRTVGYAAGARMPRHAHEYSNVTAIISGEMAEMVDAGEHRGRTCSVLLKPAGTEHTNEALGRKGTLTVTVQMSARSPLVSHWSWFEDPASAKHALALYFALKAGRDVEANAYALVGGVTAAAELRSNRKPVWLAEVLKTLGGSFGEPVSFESIADDIGLHPVYLSRAFRRHTGSTMQEYVRALRLTHARHLLSTTTRAVASIAVEAGFADPSHLCRALKSDVELTPRQYRQAVEV
jgi:AraC family transcriptional regulator